jgi:hypothetical protein
VTNSHGNGPFVAYTLLRSRTRPYEYRLVAQHSGCVYRIVWHLESAWGVYVRPDANITGMHFFADEVQVVDQFL